MTAPGDKRMQVDSGGVYEMREEIRREEVRREEVRREEEGQ